MHQFAMGLPSFAFLLVALGLSTSASSQVLNYEVPKVSGFPVGAYGTYGPGWVIWSYSTPAETARRFCQDQGHIDTQSYITQVRGSTYSYIQGTGGIGNWNVSGSSGVTMLDSIACKSHVVRYLNPKVNNYPIGAYGTYGPGGVTWSYSTPWETARRFCQDQGLIGAYNHVTQVRGSSYSYIQGTGGMGTWSVSGSSGVTMLDEVTCFSTPVDVQGGTFHACALTRGSGVKCWGNNSYGGLGDGSTTDSRTPVNVVGLSSGVKAISLGAYHACALGGGGGVKCWGANGNGQLGDGTQTNRVAPANVAGLASGVSAIVGGRFSTCAIASGGSVKCWGSNSNGELGDGTTATRLTPADVLGLSSGVTAIAAGYGHACAVTSVGGVKCWGLNDYGQLGDGTTTTRLAPVDVVGLTSGVTGLAAGSHHTCAFTSSGGVKCWGSNSGGQLGNGTTTARLTPVDVVGLTSGVTALTGSPHAGHTCALTGSRGVKCWGWNDRGQLGDGTTMNRLTPVDVVGLSSNVLAIGAGSYHSCARVNANGVKCWGSNDYGQLGNGGALNSTTPVSVVGF